MRRRIDQRFMRAPGTRIQREILARAVEPDIGPRQPQVQSRLARILMRQFFVRHNQPGMSERGFCQTIIPLQRLKPLSRALIIHQPEQLPRRLRVRLRMACGKTQLRRCD